MLHHGPVIVDWLNDQLDDCARWRKLNISVAICIRLFFARLDILGATIMKFHDHVCRHQRIAVRQRLDVNNVLRKMRYLRF